MQRYWNPKRSWSSWRCSVMAVRAGKGSMLICPYCGETNVPEQVVCCPKFLKSMNAVLERSEAADSMAFVDRVMNRSELERGRIVH